MPSVLCTSRAAQRLFGYCRVAMFGGDDGWGLAAGGRVRARPCGGRLSGNGHRRAVGHAHCFMPIVASTQTRAKAKRLMVVGNPVGG